MNAIPNWVAVLLAIGVGIPAGYAIGRIHRAGMYKRFEGYMQGLVRSARAETEGAQQMWAAERLLADGVRDDNRGLAMMRDAWKQTAAQEAGNTDYYRGLVVAAGEILDAAAFYAFRATDPKDMLAAPDPVGPENDRALTDAAWRAHLVVAGWGAHGGARAIAVRELLAGLGCTLYALKLNRLGEPGHPLYLPGNLRPFKLPRPGAAVVVTG